MNLPVITTTLWPEQEHPPFGMGYYVAPVDDAGLAQVVEGQRVILREEPDFEIQAIMHRVVAPGGADWWFGAEIQGTLRYLEASPNETSAAISDTD